MRCLGSFCGVCRGFVGFAGVVRFDFVGAFALFGGALGELGSFLGAFRRS
jgi:hypothetical protein